MPGTEHHSRLSLPRQGGQVADVAGRALLDLLRESEIENLCLAVGVQRDIGWLQVAVNDPFGVCRGERIGNLSRKSTRLSKWQGAMDQSIGELRPGIN